MIHNNGIYVIETKTFSKPEIGEAKITFNGEAIFLHGKIENNKLIIQVKAAASWLASELNKSTGRKFNVKPVVVFPGWFIEETDKGNNSDVWVLTPTGLPTFIRKGKPQLGYHEVKLATYHLSRYVRTYAK